MVGIGLQIFVCVIFFHCCVGQYLLVPVAGYGLSNIYLRELIDGLAGLNKGRFGRLQQVKILMVYKKHAGMESRVLGYCH